MHKIGLIFAFIVALEAFYIMGLEMFGSNEKLAQTFKMDINYVKQPQASVAMANQGLYNGFLGAGLMMSLYILPASAQFMATAMFLVFVTIAAIYGWLSTKNISVLFLQGTPAIIALIFWCL